MKKPILKHRRRAIAGFAFLLAVSLLLTNCTASKQIAGTSAGTAPTVAEQQEPEMQPDENCALLHIYRVGRMAGAAIGYDVYLGEEKIFRATNKSKITIKITTEGMNTLWAKTESKTELPIDIRFGQEYYISCGMKMGVLVGRPNLELVDGSTGKPEFDKIPLKKK